MLQKQQVSYEYADDCQFLGKLCKKDRIQYILLFVPEFQFLAAVLFFF